MTAKANVGGAAAFVDELRCRPRPRLRARRRAAGWGSRRAGSSSSVAEPLLPRLRARAAASFSVATSAISALRGRLVLRRLGLRRSPSTLRCGASAPPAPRRSSRGGVSSSASSVAPTAAPARAAPARRRRRRGRRGSGGCRAWRRGYGGARRRAQPARARGALRVATPIKENAACSSRTIPSSSSPTAARCCSCATRATRHIPNLMVEHAEEQPNPATAIRRPTAARRRRRAGAPPSRGRLGTGGGGRSSRRRAARWARPISTSRRRTASPPRPPHAQEARAGATISNR